MCIRDSAITFDRTDNGGYTQIVADFDFRMSGTGEGMGFALLNTAVVGKTGAVAATGGEEPNFDGALGFGFDIHQDGGEPNGNQVSVHFNNAMVTQVDAGPVVLASNDWVHAHIVVRPGGGFSDVSM